LFYNLHKAREEARYQGRILGAMADSTFKPDQRLTFLQRSYAVSKKEGDFYNCLLVADSLAAFFVEWRPNAKKAHLWLEKARAHLKGLKDRGVRKNLERLSRQIELHTPTNAPNVP
jgi:hypothetical protein